MKDDQLDGQNKNNKRCKRRERSASSSESSDSVNPLTFCRRSRKQFVSSGDDGSSNSEDEEGSPVKPRSKKVQPIILSDYETGDSNVEGDDNNDSSTESSEVSSDNEDGAVKQDNSKEKIQGDAASESMSDWDNQSEKCPICLAKFNLQVIGTPESCDHCFCLDCIQEWAKNVNTCPVDRQPFTLILVREHLEGKVIDQIQVSQPSNEQQVSEDVTFCEVCGLGDREDRMLLCDSCDNGYHMECLNPPLFHVPIEEWHCPECAPRFNSVAENGPNVEEVSAQGSTSRSRPRPGPRLLPRTRQSERVQRNIRSRQQSTAFHQSTSSFTEVVAEVERRVNVRRRATATRRTTNKKRGRNRIKRILTDDGVVEVILKSKRKSTYKKKRRSRTVKSKPRSVKGRLANRLGICGPRMVKQTIPETLNRQEVSNAPINHQRHQAGIPTLDIFGRRDQLDYFSGSDEENDVEWSGSVGVISRARVARPSDRIISRKKAATVLSSFSLKKPHKVEKVSIPADGSLLDNILNSQLLWHSKKSEIKSNSDGSLHVVLPSVSKSEDKVDVRKVSAPTVETPMFPGDKGNSGVFDQSGRKSSQNDNRNSSEHSFEGNSQQPSGSGGVGYSSFVSSVGISPLRGIAPIRFRMNAPPRRPNIHSYPTDNIPPPPLRLRSPVVEVVSPVTNSPKESPPREDEEIDIYSDIEQENNSNDLEEKSFGTLEPPPEPPFLMTMEPPPEPPAILLNLNDEASDDEASGLVIDDPPANDVYDPCAINSDDSSTEDTPLAKPPELPLGLKDSDLVADYSSDSQTEIPSYNPELPTFMNNPLIKPFSQPPLHNSSDENDEDCPNFSMYSAASMTLAQRGLPPLPVANLDIPVPPPIEETFHTDMDIPLPDFPEPKEDKTSHEQRLFMNSNNESKQAELPNDDCNITRNEEKENDSEADSVPDELLSNLKISNTNAEEDGDDEEEEEEDADEGEEEVQVKHLTKPDSNSCELAKESSGNHLNEKIEMEKLETSSPELSQVAEDECSTQGDVLDLAIESENNLEHNVPLDGNEKLSDKEQIVSEKEEDEDKNVDNGDKSDGLVDITDEDMSVYDGQDNNEDLDRAVDQSKHDRQSLDSDDDNSLVGGATSAISAGTINNSDNMQPPTLPGLEGLETETISESEDVNFDELPLEDNEQIETPEEDHSTARKKKKKKSRKTSHNEEIGSKGGNEPLEFEEGEIIDDKPKQAIKKDKKTKIKADNSTVVSQIPENNKIKTPVVEKDGDKKLKKKKDKNISSIKDKSEKNKDTKEKTIKPGEVDENIAWKKLSKSTKERNYRDGKEKEEKERDRENKNDNLSRKEKRSKEKRKELERYNVRRLISEKPKQPKKDEFGRDISPSKSGSSLSPYRPPRYRSPLRTRNRSRTRSRSYKSRSRSRGRRRRSRSRIRVRSRDRSRRAQSRDRSRRRSRSQNDVSRSKDRRKTPDNLDKTKSSVRSTSRTRRKSRSRSVHSRRRSLSYSRSWTPSWSGSSKSRSQSRRKRRSRSVSRSKSRSWTRDQNVTSKKDARAKDPPKNLTVIVTNKDALKKKEKKKPSKKKDDRRKKKRSSPAPSKEVFTSGDNILVSVNFKNANKTPEIIPASTPLLRESSKRKRDDVDGSARKKKNNSSKKSPGAKKSSRLSKINEVTRNAKPVAIIDLDLSPFREQTPSPKEVIVLSDSGDEGEKQRSQLQDEMDRLDHNSMSQSMLSLSSVEHKQKSSISQPESPVSSNFMLNSSGPKTPPEPHVKFSISSKPSQIRMLTNPLMEAEEEMPDENIDSELNEKLHKGPNTPPEPPPELNTPASPPTTPYDPFDPTKSRSPSPQPISNEIESQTGLIREEKSGNIPKDDGDDHPHLAELHSSTPPVESDEMKQTPESAKVHSTPKSDPNITDSSPKVSPSAGSSDLNKLSEDTSMKPVQKLLTSSNKLEVTVHKSPEKLITLVINQPIKNVNQTPKQSIPPLKTTPSKHSASKGNVKHQLFSNSLMKQVPMLSSLIPGPPVYTPMGLVSSNKTNIRAQQNGDPSDDMDIDLGSPYSPGSSEGDDLFEPPVATPPRNSAKSATKSKTSSGSKFDNLFGSSPAKLRHGRHSSKMSKKGNKIKPKGNKKEEVKVKLDEDQLKILDELPSSAVEMQVKDKFLKKLNRQERVVEEVKLVLKPHYAKKHVNKEEYKEILRRSVPKICHNKSGEINPIKIQSLVEAYVKKFRYSKKKASGAITAPSQNKPKPQKTLWS